MFVFSISVVTCESQTIVHSCYFTFDWVAISIFQWVTIFIFWYVYDTFRFVAIVSFWFNKSFGTVICRDIYTSTICTSRTLRTSQANVTYTVFTSDGYSIFTIFTDGNFTVDTVSTVFTGDGYTIFTSHAIFTRNANGVQAVKIFIKTDYNFTIFSHSFDVRCTVVVISFSTFAYDFKFFTQVFMDFTISTSRLCTEVQTFVADCISSIFKVSNIYSTILSIVVSCCCINLI